MLSVLWQDNKNRQTIVENKREIVYSVLLFTGMNFRGFITNKNTKRNTVLYVRAYVYITHSCFMAWKACPYQGQVDEF